MFVDSNFAMKRSNAVRPTAGGKRKKRQAQIVDDADNSGEEVIIASAECLTSVQDRNLPSTSTASSPNPHINTKTARSRESSNKYSEFYKVSGAGEDKHGECLLCLESGKVRRIKMKDANTSGHIKHLKSVHADHPLIGNIKTIKTKQSSSPPNSEKPFNERVVEWLAVKCLPFSFFDDDATQDFFRFVKNISLLFKY